MVTFQKITESRDCDCVDSYKVFHHFENNCFTALVRKGEIDYFLRKNCLQSFFIDAGKQNSLSPAATEMKVEATIKSWLRFAFERSEGRKQRNKKKAKPTTQKAYQQYLMISIRVLNFHFELLLQ